MRSMLDAPVCTVRSMLDASAKVKRHMDSTGKRIPRPKKCGRKKNSAEEHRVAAEITELLHVTKGKRYKGRPRLKQCTYLLLTDSELLYILSRVHPFHVCYLVRSSRVRLLVITMIIFLRAFRRSLAEPHSSVSVQFVTALMSSSQHARGLPLFLVPLPILNIIDFSKLSSLRMICPKYDNCCFFINASSGFVALIPSITDLFILLAVHGIRSSLLHSMYFYYVI